MRTDAKINYIKKEVLVPLRRLRLLFLYNIPVGFGANGFYDFIMVV